MPGFFIFNKISHMRVVFLLACIFSFSFTVVAQQNSFPKNWEGQWRGQLQWFKTGQTEAQEINMELRIHSTDKANTWSWQIIYGDETKDNRPYLLTGKDSSGIHWLINENNGIVIDQFWIANKLCGAFTVQNSTIVNNYWMEDDKLIVEFYNVSAKPIATTGNGTDDSPKVDSYKIGSYQKAVLRRQ
jgi:hypothetical protein